MNFEERLEALEVALEDQLEDFDGCKLAKANAELTLTVPVADVTPVMQILRSTKSIAMETCIDICGVDYATYGETEWVTTDAANSGFGRAANVAEAKVFAPENRFAAVYHLLSVTHNTRLRVKVFLDADHPIVDSVVSIWTGADWFEREAFDMYGIMFSGHPDLRRILTDYGFIGHPFRKDFPLIGQVEMRYDAEQGRVIYQPVSIEPRTLVPRVIRDDARYEDGWKPEDPAEKAAADEIE